MQRTAIQQPPRPVGVAVLSACNLVYGALSYLTYAPRLLFPPTHAFTPPGPLGWTLILLFPVLSASAVGLWSGNKLARNLCLGLITIYASFPLIEGAFIAIHFGIPKIHSFSELVAQYGSIFFAVLWPSINYSYLLTGNRRAFFANQRARPNRALLRRMALTAIGIIVIVTGGIEGLFRLGLGPFHLRPPPILREQLSEPPDLSTQDAHGRNFTAVLTQRFPTGTSARKLAAELQSEGFVFPEIPDYACTSREKAGDPGMPHTTCPYEGDPKKQLWVSWLRSGCVESAGVYWTTERTDVIEKVNGEYHRTCEFFFEPHYWYWY